MRSLFFPLIICFSLSTWSCPDWFDHKDMSLCRQPTVKRFSQYASSPVQSKGFIETSDDRVRQIHKLVDRLDKKIKIVEKESNSEFLKSIAPNFANLVDQTNTSAQNPKELSRKLRLDWTDDQSREFEDLAFLYDDENWMNSNLGPAYSRIDLVSGFLSTGVDERDELITFYRGLRLRISNLLTTLSLSKNVNSQRVPLDLYAPFTTGDEMLSQGSTDPTFLKKSLPLLASLSRSRSKARKAKCFSSEKESQFNDLTKFIFEFYTSEAENQNFKIKLVEASKLSEDLENLSNRIKKNQSSLVLVTSDLLPSRLKPNLDLSAWFKSIVSPAGSLNSESLFANEMLKDMVLLDLAIARGESLQTMREKGFLRGEGLNPIYSFDQDLIEFLNEPSATTLKSLIRKIDLAALQIKFERRRLETLKRQISLPAALKSRNSNGSEGSLQSIENQLQQIVSRLGVNPCA